jgi:RHS repeat-associated protein
VDYDYDILNRLSEVKDNRLSGSQNTSYSYDAVGNLQSYSYPNTVTTSYAYNNLNRLTTMTVSNPNVNLASYAYTLGASGNRTQVVENNGRTVNYAYDDLYRLTSETIANSSNNGSISYNFDAVGNRLQRNSNVNLVANQTSTYDANDRLNSDTYDNNGSTKVSNGKSYNYDFENKLTSTSDGITVVYDGDGNRVSKTANGVTTKYLVDTNNLTGYAQVVEELQNGSVTKQYTYGLDLISQRQLSGVSFYNYDGHGSVRGLSNISGSVTDTYTYDAFGTIIERTGTTENSYLYAGEQFDSDLGFYYNRARYLNVETGRFISFDTYEGNNQDPISLHKYLYANADGVNKIDPSGNYSIGELVQTVQIYTRLALTTLRNAYSAYSRVNFAKDRIQDVLAFPAIFFGILMAHNRTDSNGGYSIDASFPLKEFTGGKYENIKIGIERRFSGFDGIWNNVIRLQYGDYSRIRYSFDAHKDGSITGGALSGGININLYKSPESFLGNSFEIDLALRAGTSFGKTRDAISVGLEFKHKYGFGSSTFRIRLLTYALTGRNSNDYGWDPAIERGSDIASE